MVGRFEAPLVRYATRILGDRERARDVVQDTFVRLCQADRTTITRPREWLFRVCRNRAIDLQRRDKRVCGLDRVPEELTGTPPAAERRAAAGEIRQLFERLPPSQQRVMALRFDQGESYRGIGARTGLATGTVSHLIHQGVRRLRSHLGVTVLVLLAAGAGGAAWWQAGQPGSATQTLQSWQSVSERASSVAAGAAETNADESDRAQAARASASASAVAASASATAVATKPGPPEDAHSHKSNRGQQTRVDEPSNGAHVNQHQSEAQKTASRQAAKQRPSAKPPNVTPSQQHKPAQQHKPGAVAHAAERPPPPKASVTPKGPEPPPQQRTERKPTLMFEME